MKITSQSSDQMALQDGNIASGVFGGIVLVGISGYWAYYLFTAPGQSINIAWIPGIIAIVGLIMIVMVSSIAVVIDKSQGQVVFSRKRMLGISKQVQNISDVVRVELRRGSYRQGAPSRQGFSMNGGRQVLQSQTVVLFKDGTEMPLENKKDRSGRGSIIGAGVMMAGEGKELSISQQVATFLDVPFEEMGNGGGITVGMHGESI
jgi:hypothetical protein